MATDTAIAPPEGFVLDAPSAAAVPPPAGFVLDSGAPSAPRQGLTLVQMARLKTMPGMPGMFPPVTAIQRDALAAGRVRPGAPPGITGRELKDLGGKMVGSVGDILSLDALRRHLEPGEMVGIPPWAQTAERLSEAGGAIAAPILTGAGVVGPLLGEAGAAGQALSRLAIPAAGAANLRNLGKATGAVAGTPAAQRQPGEMAAALVGDAGSAIVDTLAVLSAPTGSASEKIQAAKARMQEALTPRPQPNVETMKRATAAPFTSETVPKPPVYYIPSEVAKTVVQGAQILPRTAFAVAEALSKPSARINALEITQEVQNASRQQQAAKIHGDVRPQPIKSAGQVPAESSGSGVQSRPNQEAQEAVGKPPAIPVEPPKFEETTSVETQTGPVGQQTEIPVKHEIGEPADEYGAVYGPNVGSEGYKKLKNAQETEIMLLSDDPDITHTLQVRGNKLWLTTEKGKKSGYNRSQSITYLHIKPNGETILGGSFAHPRHWNDPLNEISKNKLVDFISGQLSKTNPIKSAGQVPAESSGSGVQSRPNQEAQEAMGQPSALPVNHSERIAKAESEIEKMTGGDTSIADGMRFQADNLGWSDEKYAHALEGVLNQFKAKLPAPATIQDIRPALKQPDATIIPGQEGQTHAQIKLNAARHGIDALNAEHGFVDARGNFMTREQAAEATGEKEPLQSERLAELQAKPAETPEPAESPKPSAIVHTPKEPLSAEHVNTKAPNAYLRVPTALLSEPGKLGAALTENAAVSGKQNRTATRRLTLLEKPGKPGVAVVSTYRDSKTGKVMMAHPDLPENHSRPHRSLNQMRAEGWVPRGTILLNEPVTNFRESYPSLEAAQKALGWPEPQTTQSQNVPEMGFEGQRPVPVVQPSQGPSEGPMTPDQAGVLYDHFSKFDSFAAAMDGLAKAPQVASLKQTFSQIMEGFPEGPDREESTMNALSKFYEDARRSKKVEFVDAISAGGDPSTHPGESGAEPGLGREVQQGHDEAEGATPKTDEQLHETIKPMPTIPAGGGAPTLPKELRGAKPRYGYQENNFQLQFESDTDKALYIIGQKLKSARDTDYRAWLKSHGWTDLQLAQAAKQVRDQIKVHAQNGDSDAPLQIPTQFTRPPTEPPLPTGPGAARPHDVGVDQEALGLKPTNATFQRIQRAASNYYKGVKQLFDRRPVKADLPKLANAADNIPRMAGQAAGNSLRLRGNKEQLSAATFVMQAHKMSAPGMPYDGDPIGYLETQATDLRTAAQQFRNNKEQLEANAAVEAARHIDYAADHWDELQPLADHARKQMDAQYVRDVSNGVNVQYEDWYVPQRHDIELFTSSTGPVVLGHSKGGGPSTQFKKAKVFPDYSQAIQAGFVPRTLDISNLVENRVFQGDKIIQRKLLFDQMREMTDPVDGKPLATKVPRRIIHRPDGTSDVQESVPLGYTKFEVMPGYNLAVHAGYSRLMSALTSSSQIAESAVMGGLQDLAAVEKHIGLALDSFHASRVLQRAGTIMHKVVLGGALTRGKALVEYQLEDLPLAVKRGEITQAMADWASQPRTIKINGQPVTESRMDTVKFGVKNGLNAGRVADALYRQWLNDLPVIGAVQRWVFDKMTRSAVTQSYLIEFERVAKANPDMTATAVARKVASDLNVLFGNLQKESIFKNPSVRSINQILFLAPQWVEALARGEWRGYKQLGQGAYRSGTGKGFHFGTAGKSMGTGLAAYFIGTQLLNLAMRHHLTFQNKEKGRKLDAWIPDLTGKTPGFFISSLGVFAEITHDVLKYSQQKPDAASVVTQILENKLGSLGRSLEALFTGRDPITNEKLIGTWNRVLKAASQAAPVPITASQSARMLGHAIAPGTVAAPRPGSVQRQLTSSLGFKTAPARTGIQQMFDRARDWEAKSSDPKVHEAFARREKETFALSDYAPLRDALQSGDAKASHEAWSKLKEVHTLKQIFTEMKTATHQPFTGSKESEKAFIRSLDDEGKSEYLKAVDDRAALYQKFLQFAQSENH